MLVCLPAADYYAMFMYIHNHVHRCTYSHALACLGIPDHIPNMHDQQEEY